MKKVIIGLGIVFTTFLSLPAQVKIGDNPNTINANSMLELESTNKGFLPPRVALNSLVSVSPLSGTVTAGMLVYSEGGSLTNGYYYWNGTKWMAVSTASSRSNFVLVKSVTDFPAAVGGVITLVAGTLYEINGILITSNKIDLNGCALQGKDGSNDRLVYTGTSELFTGSNGGIIKFVTLSAASGKIFNINAGGAQKNLFLSYCRVLGSNSVGTLQGFGGAIILDHTAFAANANGIIFQNTNLVFLNNSNSDPSNAGTYETFVGAFNTIQILGGTRNVSTGNTAINVSGITTLIKGSIKSTLIYGSGTYVNGTFSNAWEVEAHGLNTEKDDVACGNLYITSPINTVISSANTPVKMLGTTTSSNLFRFTSPSNNRLTYVGSKTRKCLVICSLTSSFVSSSGNKYFTFYLAKNGVVLQESKQKVRLISNTDQGAISISCLAALSPNDYVEVWVENNTDGTDMIIQNLNLSIR